ncbi:MAG: AmmeMemoRadiSam system protein B [Candidatus Omnitrophota bacterium]|nr:AmmeMemoRadiSam system protein B [Candidatus Omnitrophota bacterium]
MSRRIFLLFLILAIIPVVYAQEIKKCEFSGSFYPADANELSKLLDTYLKSAQTPDINGDILGIISPHAGYIYSAPIAAYSYKILQNKKFDAAIIIGQSHRYGFDGASAYPAGIFSTPLGDLDIDAKLAKEFESLEFITYESKFFQQEHSIEVQLPFIIKVLGKVNIVPIIFGRVDFDQLEKLADKLVDISKKKNILIIVSSDLSHYNPYDTANKIDNKTIEFIKNKDVPSLHRSQEDDEGRACGMNPIITLILYAQARGAKIDILKYANSGDTAGDKSRVVGYVSAVTYIPQQNLKSQISNSRQKEKDTEKEEKMGEYSLNKDEKIALLKIARSTLESYLKNGKVPEFKAESQNLREKRGAFVTLKKHGELRGCIGRIVADTTLYEVISAVAIDSATGDPRFAAVRYEELKDIEIEISVLTPFEKINSIEKIEVGKHGLMIRKGFNSGLLLPQVPGEYGWDRETFLEHTCVKAGLSPDAYKDANAAIYKFSAIVFNESDFSK